MPTSTEPGLPALPKNFLRPCLLLLLREQAAHGYQLLDRLRAFGFEGSDPGGLYRTLRKLERDGWVESRWMRSVAGPRRRFYRLTPTGRRTLDEMAELITSIRDFHDTFLRAYEQAVARREPPAAEGTRATGAG